MFARRKHLQVTETGGNKPTARGERHAVLQMSSPSFLRLQFSGASGSPNSKSRCEEHYFFLFFIFIFIFFAARNRLSGIKQFCA